MVQPTSPDEMLVKFLKFVQLEECLELLDDELEIKSFADLEKVKEESLRQLLGGPATKRLLKKYRNFKNKPKDPKQPILRPLNEFLVDIKMESFEEDLKEKLYITRVEHLKFATKDDLEGILGKESAVKLLKAYSKEKQRKATEKLQAVTKNILKPIAACFKSAALQFPALRVDTDLEINVEATIENSRTSETKPPPPPARPPPRVENLFEPERELVNQDGHPSQPLPEHETMVPKGPPDNYQHKSSVPIKPPWGPENDSTTTSQKPNTPKNEPNSSEQLPKNEPNSFQQPPSNPTDPSAPPESLANSSHSQSPIHSPMLPDLMVDWVLLQEEDIEKKLESIDEELECESEWMLPDFFVSARGKEAWETFSPLIITEESIAAVRQALGLLESPDADLREALHFVRSQQNLSPFYFQRPPPEAASNTPTEWHFKTAAQMVRLRHLYGLAMPYTLQQCYKALVEADWSIEEAFNQLPWLEE